MGKKQKAKKLIRRLSKYYGVRVYFSKKMEDSGSSRFWNESLTISENQSKNKMISAFFHECGHVHCWRNGIWKSYHINKPVVECSDQEKKKVILTALKAERWVDKWAEVQMKEYFPKRKYDQCYLGTDGGDLVSEHLCDFRIQN